MKKNNPFGYKIGYRENGSHNFIRYFMTYTYPQAKMCLRHYRKSPPRERDTNRPIINPFWEIKPITKKEILAGIWDELPFTDFDFFYLSARRFLKSRKRRKLAIKSCDHDGFIIDFNARFLNAILTTKIPPCGVYFPFEFLKTAER